MLSLTVRTLYKFRGFPPIHASLRRRSPRKFGGLRPMIRAQLGNETYCVWRSFRGSCVFLTPGPTKARLLRYAAFEGTRAGDLRGRSGPSLRNQKFWDGVVVTQIYIKQMRRTTTSRERYPNSVHKADWRFPEKSCWRGKVVRNLWGKAARNADLRKYVR